MTTTISGSNGIVFPDATSMQTGQQAVKAWVNFNGEGTVAIRAGYNVASITDNGTGDYTVTFTTAMVDINYCALLTATNDANASTTNRSVGIFDSNGSPAPATMLVDSIQILIQASNSTEVDLPVICVSIFR
tara:strand:+ start:198 stop:593 length:396 start_codon:yes stop_codon:yes gene_type:complete